MPRAAGRPLASWIAVAAALGIAAALVCGTPLAPATVWTLRGPSAPGWASLTVHREPGGDAVAGRWVLVADGADEATRLVRLALGAADGAIARLAGSADLSYRPTGRAVPAPGAVWYEWSRE